MTWTLAFQIAGLILVTAFGAAIVKSTDSGKRN